MAAVLLATLTAARLATAPNQDGKTMAGTDSSCRAFVALSAHEDVAAAFDRTAATRAGPKSAVARRQAPSGCNPEALPCGRPEVGGPPSHARVRRRSHQTGDAATTTIWLEVAALVAMIPLSDPRRQRH